MPYVIIIPALLCAGAMAYFIASRRYQLEPVSAENDVHVHVAAETRIQDASTEWEAVLCRALDHIYSGTPSSTDRQMAHVYEEPPALTRTAITALVKSFEKVGTLHSTLAAMDRPGASMRELAEKVTHDPLLSGRVLKTVNSPFFRTASNVKSIHTALNILGLANLKNLVAFGAMPYSLFVRPEHQQMFLSIWQHMNATAITAATMAKATRDQDSGTLYTAGLMHDIGKLVLILLIEEPQENEIYPQTLERETARMSATHLQAAQIMARTGGIPAELHRLVLEHHLPALLPVTQLECDAAHARTLTVLFLADQVAKLISPQGTLLDDVRRLEQLDPSFQEIISRREAQQILLSPGMIEDILDNVRVVQAMLN